MVAEEEFLESWVCECGVYLGEYPFGIKVKCSACGRVINLEGFDNIHQSAKQIKERAEMKERDDRHAKQKYQAIREQ